MGPQHSDFPRNLAELKRRLAQPGTAIRGVRNDILADMADRLAAFHSVRPVVKVQGNGFAVRQPDGHNSWMDFGKASEWTFDGETFSRKLPRGVLSYRFATLTEGQ